MGVFKACLNEVCESEWRRLYGRLFQVEGRYQTLTHKELYEADLAVVVADHVLQRQEAAGVGADGNASRQS